MSPTTAAADDSVVHFDPFSEDFFNGPFETYRRLRNEAPVYHQPQYRFWALSRYEDVAPAMKDHETYSSAKGVSLDHFIDPDQIANLPDLIIMMDPPGHTAMRKLVNKVFTPRGIAALEPMIRATIARFADRLDPHHFDAVADFSALFPVEIISEMLGVPSEDRQQIRLLLDRALERPPGEFRATAEGIQAQIDTGLYYLDLVQQRRTAPKDDMISELTTVEIERENGEAAGLTDIEIVGFLSLLGGAGAETVTKVIGNAVVNFAANPDQWSMLRQDRSKIPAAFEEVLRYEGPSQYNIRYSLRDVTLHGVTIPRHSPVMLINGSATRDERQFPDPDRFDIERRSSGHNLGFGYGVHSCLGAALARMEGRIALDILADKMAEFDVDTSALRRVNMTNVMGYSHVPVHVVE